MQRSSPFYVFALLIAFLTSLKGDNKDAPVDPLVRKMQGEWVLCEIPDDIKPAPKAGGRIKKIRGNTGEFVQKDPKTGEIIFRHGGTITAKGNTSVKSIEFANENTKFLIGKKVKFKVTCDDGILINNGTRQSLERSHGAVSKSRSRSLRKASGPKTRPTGQTSRAR